MPGSLPISIKFKPFDPPLRYQIAPDERDCLHELLDDLGGEPSLCSLLGAPGTVNARDITYGDLVFREVV